MRLKRRMTMELKFRVAARIAKPVHEVFEAVADPAQLSQCQSDNRCLLFAQTCQNRRTCRDRPPSACHPRRRLCFHRTIAEMRAMIRHPRAFAFAPSAAALAGGRSRLHARWPRCTILGRLARHRVQRSLFLRQSSPRAGCDGARRFRPALPLPRLPRPHRLPTRV